MSEADLCLVYRYLYYCLDRSLISDSQYDQMERHAVETADPSHAVHKVGSSDPDDYSDRIKAYAYELLQEADE